MAIAALAILIVSCTGYNNLAEASAVYVPSNGIFSSVGGVTFYNTADQTTNYERVVEQFNTNVFQINSQSGGGGSQRDIQIGPLSSRSLYIAATSGVLGGIRLVGGTTASTNVVGTAISYGSSASSGTFVGVKSTNAISQTGTAAYTALQIQPTETTIGSGSNLLLQVGTSTAPDLFDVSNLGQLRVGTTTSFNGLLGIGTYGSTNGTSTISTGKWQIDGYNSAGARTCTFLQGTAITTIVGACNP